MGRRDEFVTAVKAAVSAELLADETPGSVFPVIADTPSGRRAMGPALLVVPVMWAARRISERRAATATRLTSGLPMRKYMLWAITSQRVLFFELVPGRRIGTLLGSIDRLEVIEAMSPTVGQGSRTMVFTLTGDRTVSVKIPAAYVDHVASTFSRP
jgi:hypothetical protein